jgi:amino acid permease
MRSKTEVVSKVPEVTLAFWIIKIAATTLGETGGDSVTMTLLHADKNAHNGGYLIGTAVFFAILIGFVIWQIATTRFRPSFIGQQSSLRRLQARPWPISPTALSGSATLVGRRCCSPVS